MINLDGSGWFSKQSVVEKFLREGRVFSHRENYMKQRATIVDIAQRAGVSHGTVSLVLNNKAIRCRKHVREKILRIARELNYQPNLSAKALKTRRHFTICFLVYDITDAYVVECIGAIESYLATTEYRSLWISIQGSQSPGQLIEKLRNQPMDGLVVLQSESFISDSDLLTLHGRDQMRICTLDRMVEGGHISSVTKDNAAEVRLILNHLDELGHRRIGFLYGSQNHPGANLRFDNFKRQLQERHLPVHYEWFLNSEGTVDCGYQAAKQILQSEKLPTAIIAHNDLAAFGCIRAIIQKGFTVPQKISVAGFDDIRYAAYYNPSLTTIRSDYPALAKAAVDQMIKMIENDSKLFVARHVVVPPTLCVRESTAGPTDKPYCAKL
jgi:DNA-binding LacI/PurR family transcriptional regulator